MSLFTHMSVHVRTTRHPTRSALRARTSVYSEPFLVGTVPGWGTYSFKIGLDMNKSSPSVGLFLYHVEKHTDVSCFPLNVGGSAFAVLHCGEQIGSRKFPANFTISGKGIGWKEMFTYEELKSKLDADGSNNELTIKATIVLPHVQRVISTD
jgi:hypothetical protein